MNNVFLFQSARLAVQRLRLFLGEQLSDLTLLDPDPQRYSAFDALALGLTHLPMQPTANRPPSGIVTITGMALQGQVLKASHSLSDADGLGTIGYQWFANGIAIDGATGATLLLTQAQVGRQISVRASYRDGGSMLESVTSAKTGPVFNVNDLPTGSVTITGTAQQGQTLKASNTLADADGFGSYFFGPNKFGAINYQWLADGVSISGATGSALVLAQAQVGRKISVRATYLDGGGTVEAVTSTPTAAVANVNDLPSGSVRVIGTALQGQMLWAFNSLTDADGIGPYAYRPGSNFSANFGPIKYQWLADGVAISGATGSVFVLTQAQVGRKISVQASYRDGGGTLEAVNSAQTAAVANVNEAPRAVNQSVSLDEDGQHVFGESSFGFEDAAGESGKLAAVMVKTLPVSGKLTLGDVSVWAGQVVKTADLTRLVYRPAENMHGEAADRWSYRVRDDGGTAKGGVDTSTSDTVMTLTLRPVNDAPTSADVVRSTLQNMPLNFSRGDFAFADPVDRPAHELLAVRIVTLPGHGSLSLGGEAVTAGQSIAANDLARLVYTPEAGRHGKAVDHYTFAVQDNGGTERQGVDASRTHTMTLDVVALDIPTLTMDPIAGDGVINRVESDRGLVLSGRLAGTTRVLEGHSAAAIGLKIVDLDDPARPVVEITASAYASTTGDWQAKLDAGRLADGHRHLVTVTTTGTGSAAGLSASLQAQLRVDRSAPTATLTDDVTGSIATGSVGYTVTFSEAVRGFDARDISSPNGSLGPLEWVNDRQARFTITPAERTQGADLGVRIGDDWQDSVGNVATPTSAPRTLAWDRLPPARPGLALADDTGTPGDGRSTNGLIQVTQLEASADWAYSTNAGLAWQTGSGTSFVLGNGTYRAGDVQVRQVDRAGNVSVSGQLATDLLIESKDPAPEPQLQPGWLDNATGLDVSSALVLDFGDVDLRAVAGLKIRLVDDGGQGDGGLAYGSESTTNTQVFDVAGGNVSIVGGRVTLTPTRHLDLASRYHIELDAGAFVDRSSGLAALGWTDASALNFETVRPGALGSASASWRMGTDGSRQASHAWTDLAGSGDSWSNTVVTTQADGGSHVYVCADLASEPAYSAIGFDGIGTGNFNVRITGFGADDRLYIDDQGRSDDVNDPDLTLMLAGTARTTLFFGPGDNERDGLGGQLDIALADGLAAFASRAEWQASLGLSASPYVIA